MSKQTAIVLAVLAVLIGATVAADRVLAAPSAPQPTFSDDIDVDSGTWYCLPLAGRGQTATLTVAAVGDAESRITVQQVRRGQASVDGEPRDLAPNDSFEIEVAGRQRPTAVVVRWSGGPVAASWRAPTGDGDQLGASCAPSPAPRWLMTGATTTVGSQATVYLFNPFNTDAVANIAFATPEGRQDLVSSENLSIPARDVLAVDVTELQPEQPDLGLIIEVDAGRLIASGIQEFGQPELPEVELEGAESVTDPSAPEGRTVLHAVAADATSAGFAYAAAGDETTAWITVLNPNARPSTLEVTASDQIAGTSEEIVVGPESVERIDLSAISSSPDFGVTVRSVNEVSFIAQEFVALTGDAKSVTSAPGVTEADSVNVQAVAPDDAAAELAVFNPGDATAVASVAVSGDEPDEWAVVELPAGAMQPLPFADVDVDGGAPVTVTADEPVIATLRLGLDGERDAGLLTLPLTPQNTWSGSATAPVPVRDRTLETRPVDFPVQPEG
jgi:hypothetical protein